MNLKGEVNKPKGYFSTYNLNQEHKQRLENFIYRHKPDSGEENRTKSRSPATSTKLKVSESQSKEKYLAQKESALNKKEIELKKKEKLLNQLSARVVTKDITSTPARTAKQTLKPKSDYFPPQKPTLTFSETHSANQRIIKNPALYHPPPPQDFRLSASPIAKREKLFTSKVKPK